MFWGLEKKILGVLGWDFIMGVVTSAQRAGSPATRPGVGNEAGSRATVAAARRYKGRQNCVWNISMGQSLVLVTLGSDRTIIVWGCF